MLATGGVGPGDSYIYKITRKLHFLSASYIPTITISQILELSRVGFRIPIQNSLKVRRILSPKCRNEIQQNVNSVLPSVHQNGLKKAATVMWQV